MNQMPNRGRMPAAPANTSPARPVAASGGGWMKTGAQARQQTEAEMQRQRDAAEKRGQPRLLRFRLKTPESREIVVLDREPGPCFYEHQLQNPRTGKWDIFETCPKEWEPCPICDGAAGGKESYYVMMLTIIDTTPWSNKDGMSFPHSQMLLPVKAEQQGFFLRQFDRRKSLRGMKLLMSRDTGKSASIGMPEFVEMLSEEQIIASFGHEQVTGNDGRVFKQKNADCFPMSYDKLFKKPSGEDLRRRYGGLAPAGSRQEEEDAWGGHDAGQNGDAGSDIPWDETGA
jgi:hypothetical protein